MIRALLLVLVLMAIALVAQAPAWLLGRAVQERSGGFAELRNASGTLWDGEADALFRDGSTGARVVPLGKVAWRVDRIDWQQRALIIEVRQTPAGARPATLALGAGRLRFAGGARLPAAVARRAPFLRDWTIAGELGIDSDALEWANGVGTGAATVLWRNALIIPPGLPGGLALGQVTVQVAIDGAAVTVSMRNSGGDIELTGNASSRAGTVALLLQPRPGASSAQIAWLQSHTMGRTPQGFTIDAGWPGR